MISDCCFAPASNNRVHSFRWCIASLLFLAVCSKSAATQIDTDRGNNSIPNADILDLLPGFAVSNWATLAAPDSDVDFFSVQLSEGDVLMGMTTPIASLPSTFEEPDTMATVLAFGSQQTFSDDDFADELPFDVGVRGSLFRFQAQVSSTYHIGVSGFADWEFDGAASGTSHTETGEYIVTAAVVTPTVLGGGFADTDPANDTRAGADPIPTVPSAHVAVSRLLEGDVDFYQLTLSAGQVLSAMTAPLNFLPSSFSTPDTLVGLFDSDGKLVVVNDDAGDTGFSELDENLGSDNPTVPEAIFGSAIRALIPEDGVYYLGVTGFQDDAFVGDHVEFGRYALLIGVAIPEPGSLLLGVVGFAGLSALSARSIRRRIVSPFDTAAPGSTPVH
jgi:hypothetical protein